MGIGELYGSPSFLTFILPMWVVAVGIVFTVSVTANGALAEFDDIAGSAATAMAVLVSLGLVLLRLRGAATEKSPVV
ncbi:florfenicol/chloramphenicol resistance protein [Vibrio cholerae]|nr:florfenicol/chloramphenicol resistance protein [Vibrio cholerae]